jgi:hypothetical protein
MAAHPAQRIAQLGAADAPDCGRTYVLSSDMLMRKSDSLKSYGTFQPILPYLRRSCTTAWKNVRQYTTDRKAGFAHAASSSSLIFE